MKTVGQMVAEGREAVNNYREARAAARLAKAEVALLKAKAARLRGELAVLIAKARRLAPGDAELAKLAEIEAELVRRPR